MQVEELLDILHLAEKLKDMTRHCYTSGGRVESVAEHSFRAALMAYFMTDEFPDADMNKVIKMCLIHDLGEAFTGDIPVFNKTKQDEEKESSLLTKWVKSLSEPYAQEMQELYQEMEARQTQEAKIYKAIDGLEAVIQHNESDISTWLPMEYELNKTYADDMVAFSKYMMKLREEIRKETLNKIEESEKR